MVLSDSSEAFIIGETVTDIAKTDLPHPWFYEDKGLELARSDFETNFVFGLIDEDQSNDDDVISAVPADYFTIRDRWLDDTPEIVTLEANESIIELTLGWE